MVARIIEALNAALSALDVNVRHGLCVPINGQPCVHRGGGEYVPVFSDQNGNVSYWRVTGPVNTSDEDLGTIRVTVPLRLVALIERDTCDDPLGQMNRVAMQMRGSSAYVRRSLTGVHGVEVSAMSVGVDVVRSQELQGVDIPTHRAVAHINATVVVRGDASCMDQCGADPVVVPGDCPDTTVNGVKSDTHTIAVLQGGSPVGALDPTSGVVTVPPCDPCPPCADAEVRVNGVVYDAVASGGVIDIPVVADGGGVVGTVTAGVEVTIAQSEIRTTAADTIITMLPAEQGLNIPQTRVRYYDQSGVVQLYAPSDTGYAAGTLGQMVPVPRIIIYESDGVTPHVYRDIATPAFTLPAPPVVPLKYGFGPGGGITPTWTVTADEAGTYNTYTQDGGSGTVEYKRNAGAWTVVSGTIVLAVGDTITVRRSITTNTGFSRWVP